MSFFPMQLSANWTRGSIKLLYIARKLFGSIYVLYVKSDFEMHYVYEKILSQVGQVSFCTLQPNSTPTAVADPREH